MKCAPIIRGEHVLAIVVGLSSFPECAAISCEHSRHTSLYCNCPVERFTFHCPRGLSRFRPLMRQFMR